MKYYIYILEKNNIPFYVGKTNNPKTRLSRHKQVYGNQITLEIIDNACDESWRDLEEFYIQLLRSWGFNLSNGFKGGGGASKWTNQQKSNPIRKQKLSKSKPKGFGEKIKNNRNHKEAGIKASKTLKSKGHYNKGSLRNKKISSKLKGRNVTWTGTPILQFDLNDNFIQEHASIRQAGFLLRGNQGEPIRKCLKGLQKTAYGFKWKYKLT